MSDEAKKPAPPEDEVLEVELYRPITVLGETVEKLVLRPNVKAFRHFTVKMQGEGETATIVLEPYNLALVGMQLTNLMGEPQALLNKLHPADMWEVGMAVWGFIEPGLRRGKTISP